MEGIVKRVMYTLRDVERINKEDNEWTTQGI